jgi:hypothetical protein
MREQVGYDISQAYNLFQQRRLATELSNTLGTGAKSYIDRQLGNDLNTQLGAVYNNYLLSQKQAEQAKLQEMAKLRSDYNESQENINKTMAAWETQWNKDIENRAGTMLAISNAANKYFGERFYDQAFDVNKLWTTDDKGNDVLSDYGKAYMELIFKSPASADSSIFRDWGIENKLFSAEDYDDNVAAMLEAMGVPFKEGEASSDYTANYMKQYAKSQGYDDYYTPTDVEGQWSIDGKVVDTTPLKEFSQVYSWFANGNVNDAINQAESVLSNAPIGATKNIDGITYVKTQSGVEIVDLSSWSNNYKIDTDTATNMESVTGISKSGIRIGSQVNYAASIGARNTTLSSGWYKTNKKGLYLYVEDGKMYVVSSKHFS